MAKKRTSVGSMQAVSNNNNKGPSLINENSMSNPAISADQQPTVVPVQQASSGLGAQMKQYLGKCDPSHIPKFPNLDLSLPEVPEECDPNSGPGFEENYKQHCLDIVQAVSELNFSR